MNKEQRYRAQGMGLAILGVSGWWLAITLTFGLAQNWVDGLFFLIIGTWSWILSRKFMKLACHEELARISRELLTILTANENVPRESTGGDV